MAFDVVSKVAIPIILIGIGWVLNRSIARIEVAPDLLTLALKTIDEDPRAQPAGLRDWAVDLLDESSSAKLDEGLKKRLRAGWPLKVPFEPRGRVAFELPEASSVTLDGHVFELSFVQPTGPTETIQQVELSLPARGLTASAETLETTNILPLQVGPRAYLFRFEKLETKKENRLIAWFSVWKQSPGSLDDSRGSEPDARAETAPGTDSGSGEPGEPAAPPAPVEPPS